MIAKFKNIDSKRVFIMNTQWARIKKMRDRAFAWALVLNSYLNECSSKYRLVMVTLTYHYPDDWKPEQISKLVRWLYDHLGAKLMAYFWCAETQKRGAVHYHVLLLVQRGSRIPKPDESGLWNFGFSRVGSAQSPFYICQYMSKSYQKLGKLPSGARMYGSYIKSDILPVDLKCTYKLSQFPHWLRQRYELLDNGAYDSFIGRDNAGHFVIDGVRQFTPFQMLANYGD
jgi:hypothetical protein